MISTFVISVILFESDSDVFGASKIISICLKISNRFNRSQEALVADTISPNVFALNTFSTAICNKSECVCLIPLNLMDATREGLDWESRTCIEKDMKLLVHIEIIDNNDNNSMRAYYDMQIRLKSYSYDIPNFVMTLDSADLLEEIQHEALEEKCESFWKVIM